MKRTIIILLLSFSMISLFAAEPRTIDPYRTQTISGFIDDISYLYVSPFLYEGIVSNGYDGINLDPNDTENEFRYLIRPSGTALSSPGLVIGNFSMLVTYKETTITSLTLYVTHGKLIHTNDVNTTLDYELAVLYSLSNGTTIADPQQKICYSADSSDLASLSRDKKIEINLLQSSKVSSIQDGNIYFRLRSGNLPSVTGQYTSIITFSLVSL